MTTRLSAADFFSVAVREFEHLNFTAESARSATLFIWAACIGIALAALYNFYQRAVTGGVVRALLRAEAFSPERAKTAKELGLADKPFSFFELTRGVTLRHVICRVDEPSEPEEKRSEQSEKQDGADAPNKEPGEQDEAAKQSDTAPRFYLPEEGKDRAQIRFSKEGNGVVGLVFTLVLCVGLAIALVKLLPGILGMIDGLMK